MSINSVFLRFSTLYILFAIGSGIVLTFLGIKNSTGINVAILAVATYASCAAYGKKNGQYFTNDEKIKVTIGLVVINLMIQTVMTTAFIFSAKQNVGYGLILVSIAIAGIFHSICIYIIVNSVKKQLVKQGIIRQ